MAEDDVKAKAAAEKALGTTAYKAKDFETALKHYNAAAEIDPLDMVYHLNIGAVYLETKEYEKCVEACIKASEVGMDNRADYKMIAKAYGRAAKAYTLAEDLDNAIKYYDKALANHRFKDYLNAKQTCEKKIKEAKKRAYIDPAKADEAKAKGNEHVKNGAYPDAIKEYSEALLRNPDDAKFCSRVYSNRSLCYTKLTAIPEALKDADACIKADPTFVKGYLKRGNALLTMKQESKATEAFNDALKIDPNNAEALQGLQNTRRQKMTAQAGMTDEQRMQEAMKDPEVQQILGDPAMKVILEQMQKDPQAAQSHMRNPDISRKIMKLIEAGILRTG